MTMDQQKLLADVKGAVETWLSNQAGAGESQDALALEAKSQQDLIDELLKLNPSMPCNVGPARKKPKLSDEATESSALEEDHPNPKSRTIKDVAKLIVDRCADEDLKSFHLISEGTVFITGLKRREFATKIAQHDLTSILFQRKQIDNIGLDEEYSKLARTFSPAANLRNALYDLFELNIPKEENVMKWDKNFVILQGEAKPNINFSVDMAKGAAVIITGESGSGKSWFAKKWLPSRHQDASFIYYEFDDADAKRLAEFKPPENEGLGSAYQMVMHNLISRGDGETLVYEAVSALSERNNHARNTSVVKGFGEIMQKAVAQNSTVSNWWSEPTHTLDELVIIMDEIGKVPNFGRGIVDQVRTISTSIVNRKCAKKVMLVLVGAGLDAFIGEGSIDFDADASEKAFYSKFGTDPMKSNVTVIKGPDLESKGDICGVKITEITGGTYSQVLATNTRMLTRGIIPILKSEFHTCCIENISSRRVELGSTNNVMDYAARIYMALNGLSRLLTQDRSEFEALLLNQFRLLAHQSRVTCSHIPFSNPAFTSPFSLSNTDYEAVLRAGLITADITGTSKALRYLACKGQSAPLNAQDGVAFEIVLQHHLVRLCRAEYKGKCQKYYCDRYALAQAWPPPSTKKDGLDSEEDVKTELEMRYTNEEPKKRPAKDVDKIAKLLEDKGDYDLVLRQTVGNVQGADVLVLSRRVEEMGRAYLDLYQAKHLEQVPSHGSQDTIGAFASLGVFFNPKEEGSFDTQPTTGSAGYSYKGTVKFAEELSTKLKTTVTVRKRVVVFSEAWESFSKCTSWKKFESEAAKDKNVWVWTREMVEPTISALVTGPPVKVSNEGDDSQIP